MTTGSTFGRSFVALGPPTGRFRPRGLDGNSDISELGRPEKSTWTMKTEIVLNRACVGARPIPDKALPVLTETTTLGAKRDIKAVGNWISRRLIHPSSPFGWRFANWENDKNAGCEAVFRSSGCVGHPDSLVRILLA